jgi:hypothetical protein
MAGVGIFGDGVFRDGDLSGLGDSALSTVVSLTTGADFVLRRGIVLGTIELFPTLSKYVTTCGDGL